MKSKSFDKTVFEPMCADILNTTRSLRKNLVGFEKSLDACIFRDAGSGECFLDPFQMSAALSEAQSNSILMEHLNRESFSRAEVWAKETTEASTLNFDQELRKFCERGKVQLQGRNPTYRVGGYLEVKLATKKGVVLVGSRKVKTLFARRIWNEIKIEMDEEESREASDKFILGWLHRAYQQAIRGKNDRPEAVLPIKELFRAFTNLVSQEKLPLLPLARPRAKYTDEYFRRDLSKLITTSDLVTEDGFKLNLMPTSFAREGIPLFYGEGVRIVGRVSFSKAIHERRDGR